MKHENAPRSDINITPLIDVLLVLLVIFLATITLTQEGIDLHIPAAAARQVADARPDQIVLEMAADRTLAVNKQPVSGPQLKDFLERVYSQRSDKTMYLAASGSLPYGEVIDVIDAAKGAGVQRVGVITDGMRSAARR